MVCWCVGCVECAWSIGCVMCSSQGSESCVEKQINFQVFRQNHEQIARKLNFLETGFAVR